MQEPKPRQSPPQVDCRFFCWSARRDANCAGGADGGRVPHQAAGGRWGRSRPSTQGPHRSGTWSSNPPLGTKVPPKPIHWSLEGGAKKPDSPDHDSGITAAPLMPVFSSNPPPRHRGVGARTRCTPSLSPRTMGASRCPDPHTRLLNLQGPAPDSHFHAMTSFLCDSCDVLYSVHRAAHPWAS